MEKQNLILFRNIFLKTFVVGLLFAIFLFVMTATFWDFLCSIAFSKFHISEENLGKIILGSFVNLRFYLIFVLLTPGIALHWVIKSTKNN
ncbi:MAG: hypothetical protein HY094_08635 [Candidatus Melainabacteria bacterium]|nr:hypothetical protein [Candidatus Melainabacteria bacterium]